MEESAFETAYKRLNLAQKEAVDTIDGPVMVVAGPGTGKTQILTLRIAKILMETDANPENILALTFTESGARAMRERLRSYIGAEAYRVPIYTFHGFAENLIRQYPDAYTKVVGGRPARDIEKIKLLETILESKEIRQLKPLGNISYYIPHILQALSKMKQEYISPDSFLKIIEDQEKELSHMDKIHKKGAHKGKVRSEYQKMEKGIEKNRELLFVYRLYESLLVEQKLYDFDDMILETVDALKANEDMLRDLQETYQYVLADEHQDVNGSQNEILDLLASYHERPNIFVVGDEKQAIYRFQGASLENFLYFEDRFKNTKTIALTENYRSGQTILDASHGLITTEAGPASELRVPLHAAVVEKSSIVRREFSHQAVEDDYLIDAIEKLVEKGVSLNEVAVIVRTNREVEDITTRLRKKGIPVHASADGNILSHPVTNTVLALIDAIVQIKNEEGLFRVIHGAYWGIPTEDVVRICSARSFNQPLISIISDEEKLISLGVTHPKEVLNVFNVLTSAREQDARAAPHRVLEYVLNKSGYLEYLMKSDPLEGGRVIRRLYDEIEEMVSRDGVMSLADVRSVFKSLVEHNIPLKAPYISTNEEAIQVMTAHKSKGLEFEHVFLPHLVDSVWGGRRNAEYFRIPITKHIEDGAFDSLDDERRLLYVAITRAKVGLHVSSSDVNADGREFVPTRFFEEFDASLIELEDTKKEESAFDPSQAITSNVSSHIPINKALLQSLLTGRGLSATALNNYLRDPWDYFYRNVIRIPEIQPLPMLFGTTLHNSLERITAVHTHEQRLLNDTEIKTILEKELGRLPITKEEFTRLHERGFEALLRYRDQILQALPKVTKEEFSLRVILATSDPQLPEITLTGKLDRLDFDDTGNVVRVVDYKSGKPKTKGQIEGTTKDSNGDYKRQLTFYALLLSLYDDERYQCREGLLSFIEPDSKGEIKEFSYSVTDSEIEALKQEIIRVALEITNGAFLNAPCAPDSSYAYLVNELRLQV